MDGNEIVCSYIQQMGLGSYEMEKNINDAPWLTAMTRIDTVVWNGSEEKIRLPIEDTLFETIESMIKC